MKTRYPTAFLAAAAVAAFLPTGILAGGADDQFAPPTAAPISFRSGSLRVDQYGAGGRSLVLVPGLSCGPWVWYRLIDRLAPNYTVFTVTLPGFDGNASAPGQIGFSPVAEELWAMLEARHIRRPVVIGHSLGGTLAIFLAEEHPDLLAGVVAIDGLPVFPMVANATPDQRNAFARQAATPYESMTQAQLEAANTAYMNAIGTTHADIAVAAARLEARSETVAIAAWTAESIRSDLRPGLARATVPLLEIMPYNQSDAVPPRAFSQDQTLGFYRFLLSGAPDVTIVPASPSRHFAMFDQPATTFDAIEAFLKALK